METLACQTKINFSVEIRLATPAQREAGKRLFSKLMQRAISNNIAKTGAQVVAEAPPAIDIEKPPSLTNRGASMYRNKTNED